MSVLTSRALREQLSVIMGALTTAAVAEICEAVDEGYAALRLEISRSHAENEALRKKLHLIESIVVRGSGRGTAEPVPEVAVPEVVPATEVTQQAETPQQRWDTDGGDAAAPGGDGGAAAAVEPEELPDVVLIKDEDSDSSDSFEEDNRTPADGGPAAARDGVASSAKRRWPGSDEADRKSSWELKPCGAASGTPSAPVYSVDEPVCSYSSQDPDVQLLHQESSPLPASANRPAAYFASGAPMECQSPTSRAELDLSLTWTKQAKGHVTFPQFQQNDTADGDAFGIKLVSVSGSTSTDCQLSESSSSAYEYDDADMMNFALYRDQSGRSQPGGGGGRVKRFVCSICSRTYATSQNLDVHMRIHTGERPFSCCQCGKKFTQSAHLKSHLSVHSGERPYACTLCSRCFIVKYSLKLHMKKCHPSA